MKTSDFLYHLPEDLIAQRPSVERTGSRLLHLNGNSGTLSNRQFLDLPDFVQRDDILVFNNTRVIKARLHGQKETGGAVEALVERILPSDDGISKRALAHIRASKSPKPGSLVLFGKDIVARVTRRVDDLFELEFKGVEDVYEVLARVGEVPLPPYISHIADREDESRYQTVYARYDGSVAAPTAGLHFDQRMLDALKEKGATLANVTLHVGSGTFRPVRDDDMSKHVMHKEWFHVSPETVEAIRVAKAKGGRVIAVGTTSLRSLEAASASGSLVACAAETALFIAPGYTFQTVDRLITNFHLPKSTLMMLVSAFAGHENTMKAYRHAVAMRYRFFSYGDAMLVDRRN